MKSNCHRSSGGVRIYVCLYNSTVLLYCAGVDTHTHIYIYTLATSAVTTTRNNFACAYIGLTPVTGGLLCVLHFKVARCLVALMVSRVQAGGGGGSRCVQWVRQPIALRGVENHEANRATLRQLYSHRQIAFSFSPSCLFKKGKEIDLKNK